jgi:periplasmic divalent cation tolerance protein
LKVEARYIQVQPATPAKDDAERIARALVERQLAACVQVVGPVSSTYRWRGVIETAEEWLCIAKTEARLFVAVSAAITEVHPYETPEIVATPIIKGSPGYLEWISDSVSNGA